MSYNLPYMRQLSLYVSIIPMTNSYLSRFCTEQTSFNSDINKDFTSEIPQRLSLFYPLYPQASIPVSRGYTIKLIRYYTPGKEKEYVKRVS